MNQYEVTLKDMRKAKFLAEDIKLTGGAIWKVEKTPAGEKLTMLFGPWEVRKIDEIKRGVTQLR